MKITIPIKELYTYFVIWICGNIFVIFRLIQSQNDILDSDEIVNSLSDLKPGWNLLSRRKDVSDIEWSSWTFFLHTSWFFLILTFFISELIRSYYPYILKQWYIASSAMFVCTMLGYKHLLIILVQPLIYFIVIYFGGQTTSIWAISILLLLSYNSLKYKFFFWNFLDHEDMLDEEVYLILFGMAWMELRCISYSLDFINNRDKVNIEAKDIVDMLSYVMYLPLLYTGPMVLYEEFNRSFQVQSKSIGSKLSTFLPEVLIYLLYTIILDFTFHYIYFYAMQGEMELIRKLPAIALCGGGLWMGLQFHMKYVICYGTTASFARLDNIEPPPTPRCIARIHVYSQMWRYFDVGLYKFLVKYIYRPSFNILSKHLHLPKTACKLLASLETFVFIFMWHGMVGHIFIWTVLNYIGVTLEYFGKLVLKCESYQWFKKSILKTEAMETRAKAALCTPLLALSAVSNFYLFAGSDLGNLFFEYFSQPSPFNCFILCIALYSCCHVSIALEDVNSRQLLKNINNEEKQKV